MHKSEHFCSVGTHRSRIRSGLAFIVVILATTSFGYGQATITVTSLTDALSLNGQTTLRGALQTANAATGTDTIDFAPGLFTSGAASLNMAGSEFPITHSVNIDGPGQSDLTINASQLSRIFDISSSSAQVTVSGMTLANGLASDINSGPGGSGGAIYNTGSLNVQNVTFSSNQSQSSYIATDTVIYGGGAIYNLHGNVTVQNSVFTKNSTTVNGGGILSSGGTVSISGTRFTGNTDSLSGSESPGGSIAADYGTALTLKDSTADNPINTLYFGTTPASSFTMTNSQVGALALYGKSTITESTTGAIKAYETVNISDSVVGAITTSSYVNNSILTVNRSTLSQLNQQYGNATVTNSTFKSAADGTYALTVGGGGGTTFLENDTVTGYKFTGGTGTLFFPVGGNATIRNSTIAGNEAAHGGGIVVASGDLNMDSTIVADNTATLTSNDLSGYVNGQDNLIGDPTGAFLLNSNNLTGINPDLGPLADNGGPTETVALLVGSPALDAGSNIDDLAYDQRGVAYSRLSGSGVDVGAYELQVPEPASLLLFSSAGLGLLRRRQNTQKSAPRIAL